MNQMPMLLLSLIAHAITDVGEKAETKRGEEPFYASESTRDKIARFFIH